MTLVQKCDGIITIITLYKRHCVVEDSANKNQKKKAQNKLITNYKKKIIRKRESYVYYITTVKLP